MLAQLQKRTSFRELFASQLDGKVVPFSSVVQEDRKIATLIKPPTISDPLVFSKDVPHISEFVEKFVKINPNKAFGENTLGAHCIKKSQNCLHMCTILFLSKHICH